MNRLLLLRAAVALVWLYQGLWCKLLGRAACHAAIVDGVPFLKTSQARTAVAALGAFECLLALWILDGRYPYASAFTQTLLLIGMNTGALVWSRRLIPDPAGMLLQNLAFILLAWIAAGEFNVYAASH